MPLHSVRVTSQLLRVIDESKAARPYQPKLFLLILAASLLFVALPASIRAQNYLTQTGTPTFTSAEPVELGFVNAGNGNLHIEIPVVSLPDRGNRPFVAALVYESRIWQVAGSTGTAWMPTNVQNSMGGWRLISSGDPGVTGDLAWDSTCLLNGIRVPDVQYNQNFFWTSTDGTQHFFPITTKVYLGTCDSGTNISTGDAAATDSSGFHMWVTNYTSATVFAPDGTQVFPQVEDTNGNYFSTDANGNMMDTLGRTPVKTTTSGSQITYATTNSQGTASNFIATTESLAVSTAFGQSGVTEFSGNITTIQKFTLPDGKFYSFAYDSYGELSSITLPTGGLISYTYNNFSDGLGDVNRWVSTHVSSGGTETFTPGQLSISNCPSGVLACQQVSVAKPSGAQTVYTFGINNGAWTAQAQYNSGSTTLATVAATWNFSNTCQLQNCTGSQNIQKMVQTTTLQNFVSHTVQYTYDSVSDGNIVKVQEWKYKGTQPTQADRESDISYYALIGKNAINRPASVTICPGSNPNCTTSTGAISQTTYQYDSTPLTTISGPLTQHGAGFGGRGNLTQITRWVAGTAKVFTTINYDSTGQIIQTTDPALNQINFTYADSFYKDNGANPPQSYTSTTPTNAYLTQVTFPPLGGSMTFGYYFNTGKRALSKDLNGADSYAHFIDSAGLDRLTNVYAPLVSASRGWQLYSYTGETQIDAYTSITSTSPSSSCTSCVHSEKVLDNLGRPTNNYLVNDPDGETTVSTAYDTSGRVSSSTLPYRSTSNGQDSYTYDGLNRVIQVTHTDTQSVKTYYGSAVTTGVGGIAAPLCGSLPYFPTLVVDEVGKKRETWVDGYGRVVEVDEPDSSNNLTVKTCYTYDLNNNLTTVQQSGQTRSYVYDGMSRVTEVTIPETSFGTRGTFHTFYAYLTTGGLACSGNPSAVCQRTDPRSTITTYSYDALNRITSISYSDSTHAVTYCYDGNNTLCGTSLSISNGLGRRTAMSDASGNTAWSYYTTGQIQTEQRTIAGITNSTSYTYNLNNSLASITYPSGHTVAYATGNAGRPQSATDSASGINYAMTASYAPIGALTAVLFGNVSGGFHGVTEGRSYNNRGQLTVVLENEGSGLQITHPMSLTYCYSSAFTLTSGCPRGTPANNNGSTTGIVNGVYSGETQGPTYDNLNRIASDETAGTTGSDCWGQNFTIDAVSNLTNMATSLCSIGTLTASTDGNNHLTNTQGTYTYDNAGNMSNDGANAYSYDAEDRISSAAGVNYTYDGNGMRVEKSSGTLYWRGLTGDTIAESDLSGNFTSEYVYFAGRKIARRDGHGNVFYMYSDNLGTIHTITDSSGNACYDASFTPYGQEVLNPNVTNTCGVAYKFTGYERDVETGLDYARARYYSSRIGRFMSIDPVGGSILDPQSFNRYGYVDNDTMNQIDPTGTVNVPGYRGFGGGGGLLTLSQELQAFLSGGGPLGGWSELELIENPIPFYGWSFMVGGVSSRLIGQNAVNPTEDTTFWSYGVVGYVDISVGFAQGTGAGGVPTFTDVRQLKLNLKDLFAHKPKCADLVGGQEQAAHLVDQATILQVGAPLDTVQLSQNPNFAAVMNGQLGGAVGYGELTSSGPWDQGPFTILLGSTSSVLFGSLTPTQQITLGIHELEHVANPSANIDTQAEVDKIWQNCGTLPFPEGRGD